MGSFLPGEGVLSAVFYFSGNYSDGFETPLITYLHDQIFHLKKKVGPYLFWGLHINHMKWVMNLSRERERDAKGHNNYIVYIIKRAPYTWVYAASPGLSADLAAVVGLEFTIFGKISEKFRKNSGKFRKIPESSD